MRNSSARTRTRTVLLLVLLSCCTVHLVESRTLNFWNVWFKRPYKGPECVVQVFGVDLAVRPNNNFDRWSKPDIVVKCEHARCARSTPIEGNTFKPRFLWSTRMPRKNGRGFIFTVYDANVFEANEVIGRAFIGPLEAEEMIQTEQPKLITIGYNIGVMKVAIYNTPKFLKNTVSRSVKPLDEKRDPYRITVKEADKLRNK